MTGITLRPKLPVLTAARLLAVLAALAFAAFLSGVLPVQGQTDTTPPAFVSTDHNTQVIPSGTRIQLAFDEALDGTDSGKAHASAFFVTADGNDIPVTEVFLGRTDTDREE